MAKGTKQENADPAEKASSKKKKAPKPDLQKAAATPSQLHAGHRKRMRARFEQSGFSSFSEHEVLEYLLFYGIPRVDTNALAHRLILAFGSLENVLDADEIDLLVIDGVGRSAVNAILMYKEIGAAVMRFSRKTQCLRTYEARREYFYRLLSGENDEVFYLTCLDDQLNVINTVRVADGAPNHVELQKDKIVRLALRHHSSFVMIAHCHPRGIASASDQDVHASFGLARSLGGVGIKMADHIIVSKNKAVSMMETGELSPIHCWM